ncbi:MAG TPA: serine/threonine-protein kinase [Myxococcaceae bacterium]|jgi:serine/threonine protein kinase/tetratricopeptide (TPR) repeat protein
MPRSMTTGATPDDEPTSRLTEHSGPGDLYTPDPPSDSQVEALAAPLDRGAQVGRYLVLGRIGEGGMGVVYAGYDPELDRKVAIKLLRAAPKRDSGDSKDTQARLLREAQALARISHPNVVPVYDVGTYQERVFIAMEFVEGTTAKKWIKEKRPGWREVLKVLTEAGRGLAAAHAAGLVHRDFKPENVLVGRDGRVRVMDFGLARVEDTGQESTVLPQIVRALTTEETIPKPLDQLTQEGRILGTPNYMSPEQFTGRALDARTDQFSFCAALYYGLYRKRPFEPHQMSEAAEALFRDGDPTQQATAAVAGPRLLLRGPILEPPREIHVPAWVRKVMNKGLSLDPDQRYESMEALLAELSKDPWVPRRRYASAAAVLVVALSAAVVYQRQSRHDLLCSGADQRLEGVWDPAVAAEVQQAFHKSPRPYSGAALDAATAGLDTYSRAWAAMHREACEATRLRGEQTEQVLASRMLCLERRLKDLRAVTHLLASASAETIDRAGDAVHALPGLKACADVEMLLGQAAPPQDPASRDKFDKLSSLLAEAKALDDGGQYRVALEVAKSARAAADELGYEPLRAEALSRLGWVQIHGGDVPGGEATMTDGVWSAVAARHDEELLRLAIHLVWVTGRMERNLEAGRKWEKLARAALVRLGGEHEMEMDLQSTVGSMYATIGRLDLAEPPVVRAAQLAEKLPPHSPRRAYVLSSLGALYGDRHEPEKAIPPLQRSLLLLEKVRGLLHPELAYAHTNLAYALRMKGDYGSALEHAGKALSIRQGVLGADHVLMAVSHECLAGILVEQGKPKDALAHLEISEQIRSKPGSDPVELRYAYRWMGLAWSGMGDLRKAVSYLERALKLSANDPVFSADLRFDLARVMRGTRGELQRAREYAVKARDEYRSIGIERDAVRVDQWLAVNGG